VLCHVFPVALPIVALGRIVTLVGRIVALEQIFALGWIVTLGQIVD
jgi:hypothetical protein